MQPGLKNQERARERQATRTTRRTTKIETNKAKSGSDTFNFQRKSIIIIVGFTPNHALGPRECNLSEETMTENKMVKTSTNTMKAGRRKARNSDGKMHCSLHQRQFLPCVALVKSLGATRFARNYNIPRRESSNQGR